MLPIVLGVIAALYITEILLKATAWALIRFCAWISGRRKRAVPVEIVFERSGEWYFHEADGDRIRGPYPTCYAARVAVDQYCEDELGAKPWKIS